MPSRVCIARANGDRLHFVTSRSSEAEQPTWSPDGREILFVRSAGAYGLAGDYLIRRVLRTGTETEVTYVPQGIANPRWSPDGARVLFGSTGTGGKRDIFSISIDGSESRNLTMSTESERSADWHPDGSLIAFDRFIQGASVEEDRWDLFVMNADGTNVRSLGASGNAPAWSPVGDKLAVYYLVGLNEAVFVVDADEGSRTRLTRPRQDAIDPDWQPAR
jgi:TolB protein